MSSETKTLKNIGDDKQPIPCPICEDETIIIDLKTDAEYECSLCGFAFSVEVDRRPFSTTLFEIEPLTTVH